jgi:hypothetical protein
MPNKTVTFRFKPPRERVGQPQPPQIVQNTFLLHPDARKVSFTRVKGYVSIYLQSFQQAYHFSFFLCPAASPLSDSTAQLTKMTLPPLRSMLFFFFFFFFVFLFFCFFPPPISFEALG